MPSEEGPNGSRCLTLFPNLGQSQICLRICSDRSWGLAEGKLLKREHVCKCYNQDSLSLQKLYYSLVQMV